LINDRNFHAITRLFMALLARLPTIESELRIYFPY